VQKKAVAEMVWLLGGVVAAFAGFVFAAGRRKKKHPGDRVSAPPNSPSDHINMGLGPM
jgi:hypothetical protein